jgi:hypothetical protein
MAKEQNSPSHIHVELALLALESAIAGIRLIEIPFQWFWVI